MNQNNMVDEQEIDIIEFLKCMLEQWRGWLLAGVIFMLLVSGLKYVKDKNTVSLPVISSGTELVTSEVSVENAVVATNSGVALNYYII